MNNVQIASAIASLAIAGNPLLSIEEIDNAQSPYQGVLILHSEAKSKGVHVYLCDDEEGSELWMLDSTDFEKGEVNPVPLTALEFNIAIQWLCS